MAGVSWTQGTTSGRDKNQVIWAAELGLFIAIGSTSGTSLKVHTSPTGATWTARTVPENNSWRSVAWNGTTAVAVALSGTNRVMTSTDAITWTSQSASEANQWNSVVWASALSLFVAVASSGTNRVMTSPDGVTWTARAASSAKAWQSLAWSSSLSLFVAGAGTFGTACVMTSPDGTTWTDQSVPTAATPQPNSLVWSPALGMFAMGCSGPRVYTSTNGTAWTDRGDVIGGSNTVTSLAWSPEGSTFIAIGNGTGYALSSDGITWTTATMTDGSSNYNHSWNAVGYSPSLTKFAVCLGADGSAVTALGVVHVQSLTPTSGHDGGGYTITISGDGSNSGFTSGHTLVVAVYPTAAYGASAPDYSTNYSLGTIAANYGLFATNVTWVDAYTITCKVPHGCGAAAQYGLAPGAVINSVAVFDTSKASPTANLQAYLASSFTYVDPVMTSVNVVTGPSVGGTAITVTGTNFYQDEGLFSLGQNRVEFNGNIAFATYVSATQLTIVSPPYNGDGDYVQTLTFVPSHLSNGANGQTSTVFAPASSSLVNNYTYTPDWWRFQIPAGLDFNFPPFSWLSYGPPDVTGPDFDWLPPTFNVPRRDWPRVAGPPTLWWTLDSAPDHNGWWGSTASMGGSSFLLNSTDRPVAPRPWTKISTFSTSDTAMLGGSPGAGCVINNRLIYPASAYSGSYPTIRLYNGRSDYQLGTVPGTAAGTAPYAIMSMLAANGTIYYSTIDTGSNSTNWVGRVFSFDILSGVSTPIGAALTTGHVPYALAWHNGRLWCGTHRQSTAAVGHIFWIRPGIDTDWTDDHTLASGSVSSMLSFQGKLYVGTTDAALAFARLLKRDTAGAWSTADTGVGGTAKASNGWLALADFGDTLYASYWNDDATPISKIRKSVDGTTWTTAYTGATTTLRPFIGMTTDKTYLIAIAGGLGRTSAILRTSDGTTWVDETAYLESTTETALPIFGTVIH